MANLKGFSQFVREQVVSLDRRQRQSEVQISQENPRLWNKDGLGRYNMSCMQEDQQHQ